MKKGIAAVLLCCVYLMTIWPGTAAAVSETIPGYDPGCPVDTPDDSSSDENITEENEDATAGSDAWFGYDFIRAHGNRSSETNNGVSFSWTNLKCSVSGTSSNSGAAYKILDMKTRLPEGMYPGDKLFLSFQPSKETVNLRFWIAFWSEGNTQTPIANSTILSYRSTPVIVPENAVGITVQICVPKRITVNYTVHSIELVKLQSIQTDIPLMVSFVDDDTSGWSYVTKYHDACRHNGIFGSYAVLTKYSDDGYVFKNGKTGQEMRELLLGYQTEGFGMLLHGYRQSSSDPWQSMGTDPEKIAACYSIVQRGLQQMNQWGFTGYEFWVTPYGVHGAGARKIAEDLELKCLISTNNGRHNSMHDYDNLFIKRVALNKDDNGNPNLHNTMDDVKREIDECVAAGAGWLIITTHFNEWGGQVWNASLDENGWPVGYDRFNEAVQYALDAGLTPVTVPEGWAQYESILNANRALFEQARTESAFMISAHPKDLVCNAGEEATFTVEAEGADLTYQWQYKTVGGTGWYNWSKTATAENTLHVLALTRRNGYSFRCLIRNANGDRIYTDPVKLSVNGTIAITRQPESVTMEAGETATFTVEAEGRGLTYQWQYKTVGGTGWYDWSKTATAENTLHVLAKTRRNGYTLRCLIRSENGDEVYTDPVKLNVNGTIAITRQPESVTMEAGETATFTVEAEGRGLTYQWQYKTVGGTGWYDWSKTATAENTLHVLALTRRNGYMLRCLVRSENGDEAYTSAAMLTVRGET